MTYSKEWYMKNNPLSVCWHIVFQIQAILLGVNTFKLINNLSVLLFARYTLKVVKILRFELASWACLLTTSRYLATYTT